MIYFLSRLLQPEELEKLLIWTLTYLVATKEFDIPRCRSTCLETINVGAYVPPIHEFRTKERNSALFSLTNPLQGHLPF